MKKMMTVKPHRFRGKTRAPGDEYEAGRSDVRVIQALGWAIPVVPIVTEPEIVEKPKRKYTYKRRDMVAEPPNVPPAVEE